VKEPLRLGGGEFGRSDIDLLGLQMFVLDDG